MNEVEYLVGFGTAGDFGRFRALGPTVYERGDRVVVCTHRGVEAGHILRIAAPGHARFLPNTTVGQLLRPFGAAESRAEADARNRQSKILARAGLLAVESKLPLTVLDVEILLDGEHAVLQHVCSAACDVRPFVSALSREFELHIFLTDLSRHDAHIPGEEAEGTLCERCGSDRGCGECGSGGCATCSSAGHADTNRFAELREQMERQRVSLL
jgi:hypothetical protein